MNADNGMDVDRPECHDQDEADKCVDCGHEVWGNSLDPMGSLCNYCWRIYLLAEAVS